VNIREAIMINPQERREIAIMENSVSSWASKEDF
jgi:hypothetical protein